MPNQKPDFREFRSQWGQAANELVRVHGADSLTLHRELQKALSGLAKTLVEQFDYNEAGSYKLAWERLVTHFWRPDRTIDECRLTLLKIPRVGGSAAHMAAFQAQLENYRAKLARNRATAEMMQFAYELSHVEKALNKEQRDDWVKLKASKRDIRHPIGYRVTWDILMQSLRYTYDRVMNMEAADPSKSQESSKKKSENAPKTQKAGAVVTVYAASQECAELNERHGIFAIPAGQTNRRKGSGGNGGSASAGGGGARPKQPQKPKGKSAKAGEKQGKGGASGIFESCPICAHQSGKGQLYAHSWPYTCPTLDRADMHEQIRKKLLALNACRRCLCTSHETKSCPARSIKCREKDCGQNHASLFHRELTGGGAPKQKQQQQQVATLQVPPLADNPLPGQAMPNPVSMTD